MHRVLVMAVASLALCLPWVAGNLISSPADLNTLLNTEDAMLAILDNYIEAHEEKTNLLRRLLQRMRDEHAASVDEPTSSSTGSRLHNPVAAFRLVSRLASDWRRAEAAMFTEPGSDLLAALVARRRDAPAFPTDTDVEAAADALMRLQDTYRLETAALAQGELHGIESFHTGLSADDCFQLGKSAVVVTQNYVLAESWMNESLARYDQASKQSKAEIMGFLAYSRYKLGDVRMSLWLTQQALLLDPGHELSRANLAGYEAMVVADLATPPASPSLPDVAQEEHEAYTALCRGEVNLEESARSKLRCRFVSKGSSFLRLAPLKEEEAFLSPRILLYHDVISDGEIDAVVALTRPKLDAARVVAPNAGDGVLSEVAASRVARSGWLQDDSGPAVAAVSQRAAAMLGLELHHAEQLQVATYALAGHYMPHFDFTTDAGGNSLDLSNSGNRIATALFYMNDVALGGATVFPTVKVSVFPAKGAAVVWFNLHQDGTGDLRTKHAGCPVLAGNKWVANKWFRERGQEFARPCGLVEDSKPRA